MNTPLTGRAAGLLGYRHRLDRQHREHAGHQVQDQSAQQGEDQRQAQVEAGIVGGGGGAFIDRDQRIRADLLGREHHGTLVVDDHHMLGFRRQRT